MKSLVIYSGEARTFKEVFANQYWHVLRKLGDVEFFVSVQDDANARDMELLLTRYPAKKVHIEYVQQPDLPEPQPNLKWLAMYPPSTTLTGIVRQLWSLDRAWQFVYETVEYHRQGLRPEQVIRLRPDLAFARFELPRAPRYSECITPWWARWGGINDRVAVMGWGAAPNYFKTYPRLASLRSAGCPLHPETLIAASLEMGNSIVSYDLATEFATIRANGEVVKPSITDVDLVEYARVKA